MSLPFLIESDAVHIWPTRLDLAAPILKTLSELLSPDEQRRAARLKLVELQTRFRIVRGLLRSILSRYLSMDPAAIRFEYGPTGKPSLAKEFSSPIHFNSAHSGNLLVVVVTTIGPIGVDVEEVSEVPDQDKIVARFFSSNERAAFQKLEPPDRTTAFFRVWTRKEAVLKALGTGLAQPLDAFDVSLAPGKSICHVGSTSEGGTVSRWHLHDLNLPAGSIGSVAVASDACRLEYETWQSATSSFLHSDESAR